MKNYRGYTLILVVFTIVLLGVLTFTIMTFSNNTLNTSSNERTDQAVFYIAETAVTELKDKMTTAINNAMTDTKEEYDALSTADKLSFNFDESFLTKVVDYVDDPNVVALSTSLDTTHDFVSNVPFEEHFGKTPTAKYAVVQQGTPASGQITYTIQAIGEINGKTRTTSQKMMIAPGEPDAGSGEDFFITFDPINPINVNGTINIKNLNNALTVTTPIATSLSKSANDASLDNGFSSCEANCEYNYQLPDFAPLVAYAKLNYQPGNTNANPVNGPLFYSSWSNINSTVINGVVVIESDDILINGGVTINGAIIAPYSNVTLLGQATVNGPIICKTFTSNNGQLTGEYTPDPITIPGTPSYKDTKPAITEDPLLEK